MKNPKDIPPRAVAKVVQDGEPDAWYPLVLIFTLVALGIFVGGTLSYRNYERHFRTRIEEHLSAIAELKVDDLVLWRRERLGDARIIFKNASFSGLVRRFLDRPDDAEAQAQLRVWLEKYQAANQYERIFLLDAQGVERMSTAGTAGPAAAVVSRRAGEILRSREIGFQDFYRNEQDQRVYLATLVPILEGPDFSQALGVLVLNIDPAIHLYSAISRWPTPSRTAETLLVRRDGNDALFLNELKFRTNSALTFRIPLARTNVPAVKAVLGQQGIVEGIDYHGEPVVAALRAIPDSPWFMVARMDTAEVYAPLRARLWLTVLLMAALLLGSGASVGLVWRQQRVRYYRDRLEAAAALQLSQQKLAMHVEQTPLAVIEFDLEGRVREWNPAAVTVFGYSREEAIGQHWSFIVPAAIHGHLEGVWAAIVGQRGGDRSTNENLTKDGRTISCEWFNTPLIERDGRTIGVASLIQDITERKRMEVTLRESEERYRTILEQAADAVFMRNETGRILEANQKACQSLGYSREELLAKSIWDIDPEALQAGKQRLWGKIIAGEQFTFESRQRRKDGSFLPVEVTLGLVRLPSGPAVLGLVRDITKRKRAQEALRESEERFRRAVVDSPFPIMLHAEDGTIVQASNSWCEITGYTREELATIADWTERAYGERKTLVQAEIDRLYGLSHRVAEGDYTIRTKRGGTRIWDFSSAPLGHLPDGRRLVISMAMDVTERRQAEAALRESEMSLRETQRIARLGSYVLDVASGSWSSSDVLDKVFGIDEAYKRSVEGWLALVHPDDRTMMSDYFRNEVLAQGRTFDKEYRIVRHNDQAERWVHGFGKLECDAEGHPLKMHGTIQDVTERRQAEEEIRQLNRTLEQRVKDRTAQLETANKELEAFSYSVSHDLRAPLRAIDGFARILEEDYTARLDDEGRRLLGIICGEAKRMGQLIDDLLAFSRMSRQQTELAQIDMTALAQAVFDEHAAQAPGRQLRLKLQPLPPARGDRALLRQALANLISNAIKYTRSRAVADIEIGGRADGGENLYHVKDNGVGFDMKYAGKLFGVFQRLHTADEFEGNGVGLALVQRVIHRHGGRVWAEGKLNEGSTFYFTLPIGKNRI